jgi:hypothetical protein
VAATQHAADGVTPASASREKGWSLVTIDLRKLPSDLVLKSGAHDEASGEMCAMEAVAYLAREPWSDAPACACPVIAAFIRTWNDSIRDDAHRTAVLEPFLIRLAGSRSTPAVEQRRAHLALDWNVRAHAPAFLNLLESLRPHAAALSSMRPLVSADAIGAAAGPLSAAQKKAADEQKAAWDAWAAWDARAAWAAWAAWDKGISFEDFRARMERQITAMVCVIEQSTVVLVTRMLNVTPETSDADLIALCEWPAIDLCAVMAEVQ